MNNVQGVKNEFLGKYQEGQHHLILNSLNTERKKKKDISLIITWQVLKTEKEKK